MINIRPVALYAISDHIARQSRLPYGVLVGKADNSAVTVTDGFELKMDLDSGVIDFAYIDKRLNLLLAVSPNAALVGLYAASGDAPIPEQVWLQFDGSGYGRPPVYVTFSDKQLKGYLLDLTPVKVDLSASSTETIATSTMKNHPHYSTEESELIQTSDQEVLLSLKMMGEKVRTILRSELTPYQESQVVHLANVLASFEEPPSRDSLQLLSSRLAILTNQLTATQVAQHLPKPINK